MYFRVDGRSVYAYDAGHGVDPARPGVVFIHGAGHDHSVWALQSRYLAFHGYNVLAIDLPGHGRSAGPGCASIGEMADCVAALAHTAGLSKPALIGHSMGALIALETAARYAASAGKIALLGVALPMTVSDALLGAAREDEATAVDMVTIWGHQSRAGGNPNPGMWMVGMNERINQRNAAGTLARDLTACNAYRDGLHSAKAVTCPALVILGKRDVMTPPKSAQALIEALPQARSLMLEAGHALMSEQPGLVLEALREFLGA